MIYQTEFLEKIQDRTGMSKNDARQAYRAVFGTLGEFLSEGASVHVKWLGRFDIVTRKARKGLAFGTPFDSPDRKKVKFRACKGVADTLIEKTSAKEEENAN